MLLLIAALLSTVLKQVLQHCCTSAKPPRLALRLRSRSCVWTYAFQESAAHEAKVRSTSVTSAFANAGLVPEKLVKQLCSNRVNYYFAQINTTTIHMTNLFAEEYKHSQNAVFKVLDRGATASTFIPMVVDNVRDSMRRSAFFASGKTASSSGRGAGKGDPRTIFHSVL